MWFLAALQASHVLLQRNARNFEMNLREGIALSSRTDFGGPGGPHGEI